MVSGIAAKYARAFFELVSESTPRDLEKIGEELALARDALGAEADTRRFIASRVIAGNTKKDLLRSAFGGKVDQRLLSLLCLLVDRGRTETLPEIAEEYGRLERRARGLREVKVWSAFPLTEEETRRIAAALEKRFGGGVILDVKVKPSLIAGVLAESEGREIQLSVEGQLKELSDRLISIRAGG